MCLLVLRQALDLAAEATTLKEFKDWWWKARLGKCYYKLGKKSFRLPVCEVYARPVYGLRCAHIKIVSNRLLLATAVWVLHRTFLVIG